MAWPLQLFICACLVSASTASDEGVCTDEGTCGANAVAFVQKETFMHTERNAKDSVKRHGQAPPNAITIASDINNAQSQVKAQVRKAVDKENEFWSDVVSGMAESHEEQMERNREEGGHKESLANNKLQAFRDNAQTMATQKRADETMRKIRLEEATAKEQKAEDERIAKLQAEGYTLDEIDDMAMDEFTMDDLLG
eukprot:gnl/TRDRNA2_/TRDRNA2_187113_c0_seq1.p1 gnl/TRDRNA2_/TRDRNA2_187113_c0~~gnl/TRDRNA2_/TRDRNA2_187113_c0_seq1.p1  ORF type:complete len:196 (-),score=57.93 gnl/TRDRNA2_/TRDRNA2_187113_c0_seq1:94-681(-)